MRNVLAIIAHPDDLELMAGGTVIKWIGLGINIYVICMTDGGMNLPSGKVYRSSIDAADEALASSKSIGFVYRSLGLKTLYLQYDDSIIVEILSDVAKYNIDTIMCPHEGDLNHDHQVTARLALAASRRVPNVLMGQINYFLRDFFVPNVFVDISETWEKKIEACMIYKSQWRQDWYEFLDATTTYYGKIIGVERAEGFYSPKFLL